MSTEIELGQLGDEIAAYLEDFRKEFGEAIELGLDKAARIAIRELEVASPKRTGRYAKNWHVAKPANGGHYWRRRFIRNRTKVKRYGREVNLVGILEYSMNGRPHMAKAIRKMNTAIRDAIQIAAEKCLMRRVP